MWQIIINGPGYFDTTYELPEGITHLGRADENDIVLGGDLVSRRHARMVVNGDTLLIEDLGSRNGSRINGIPLQGSRALGPGDTLSLGENTLSVRQPHKVENAATEMVDQSADGVRRFGHGVDVGSSVILTKNVQQVDLLRALDNFEPSAAEGEAAAPVSPAAGPAPDGAYETLVLLFRIAESLATATSLKVFLADTMDRVLERVDATTAVVLLRHPVGALVPAAVRHRGQLARGEVPVSDGIVEEALRQGRALAVGDVRDDRRFAGRESVILYGVNRVLCIPIGLEPPFAGVLYVNISAGKDTALEGMLDACTAVAHLVGTGVQKFYASPEPSPTQPLRRALERFHSPEVAERRAAELQSTGGRQPELETRNLTFLHAELVGFGALCVRLGAPRATALLDDFHSRLGNLLFSFEGTLEASVGESLRAFFGAPYPRSDDAVRALRAALALRADWERLMASRPMDERCELRIGLNTTRALVGLVGPPSRPSYSAVGEGVHLASWVASAATPGQILITGKTLAVVGARFDVMPLGERLVRPPHDKVAVFEVLDEDVSILTHPGVG